MRSPKILAALAAAVCMSWASAAAAQGEACPQNARDLQAGSAVADSVTNRPVVWKAEGVKAGSAVELAAEGAVRVTILKQEASEAGAASCQAVGAAEAGTHRLADAGTYFFRVERGPAASGAIRYSLQIKG